MPAQCGNAHSALVRLSCAAICPKTMMNEAVASSGGAPAHRPRPCPASNLVSGRASRRRNPDGSPWRTAQTLQTPGRFPFGDASLSA